MELEGAGRNESLTKAFSVLGAISEARGAGVATGAIVAATGLPRSTALRILGSLLDLGAVGRLPDRTWNIGPTIGHLARHTSPILRLDNLIEQELRALTSVLQETSMLAIPTSEAAARILHEVEGPRLLGVKSRWADRVIDYSASGFVRTLLAEMPPEAARTHLEGMEHPRRTAYTKTTVDQLMDAVATIRRDGHSAVVNELEDGIAGVGITVRDEGLLIAQLAVYLPSSRLTAETHQRILNELRTTSQTIGLAATRLRTGGT